MPNRDLIVFDLDGVLADFSARAPLLSQEPTPWDHFFALSYQDKPIEPMCDMFRMYQTARPNNCVVSILTSRPARWRLITNTWLRSNNLEPDMLYMRPDQDRREDVVYKAGQAEALLDFGWDIKLAFDDRQEIVDMWRAKGITCLHIGDPDAR
jgi:FMN phosphatase YigB (HAD superfamily)